MQFHYSSSFMHTPICLPSVSVAIHQDYNFKTFPPSFESSFLSYGILKIATLAIQEHLASGPTLL